MPTAASTDAARIHQRAAITARAKRTSKDCELEDGELEDGELEDGEPEDGAPEEWGPDSFMMRILRLP
ncbi:MAG: hypothetical protein ACR2RL_05205 [Gammaproteobacteria bacterium]